MVGYMRTEEEVRQIQDFLAPGRFMAEELAVSFQTTWEFAREVLPPILEPMGDKEKNTCGAYAWIAEMQSAFCGTYPAAVVQVGCSYNGREGYWVITLVDTPELPIALGRDLMGEPKKTGLMGIARDGKLFHGYAERKDEVIFEIEAEIPDVEVTPPQITPMIYDIKMVPHSAGGGLEWPPKLLFTDWTFEYTSYREGTGSLMLHQTQWDHVHEVPIVKTDTVSLAQWTVEQRLSDFIDIEDSADEYRRYMWDRNFDDVLAYRRALSQA